MQSSLRQFGSGEPLPLPTLPCATVPTGLPARLGSKKLGTIFERFTFPTPRGKVLFPACAPKDSIAGWEKGVGVRVRKLFLLRRKNMFVQGEK